jgi:hypothetical protein
LVIHYVDTKSYELLVKGKSLRNCCNQWRRHMGALGARAPPEKLNCRNFEAD